LWTGLIPNILRNSVMNAAEIASYDAIKQYLINKNVLKDNRTCHCLCGLFAGSIAATISNPLDFVKVRIMNQSKVGNKLLYKNGADAFYKIFKTEGFFAFYKGYEANVVRVSSFNMCIFMTYE